MKVGILTVKYCHQLYVLWSSENTCCVLYSELKLRLQLGSQTAFLGLCVDTKSLQEYFDTY